MAQRRPRRGRPSRTPRRRRRRGAHADPYDYFHINSIELRAGRLAARLGPATRTPSTRSAAGRRDPLAARRQEERLRDGAGHALRLAARRAAPPDGTITLFDNGADANGGEALPRSRPARRPSRRRRPRSCAATCTHAACSGRARATRSSFPTGTYSSAGEPKPYFTEFDRDGTCRARRAFRHRGRLLPRVPVPVERAPAERPAAVASRADDGTLRVSASWNGATGGGPLAGAGGRRREAPRDGRDDGEEGLRHDDQARERCPHDPGESAWTIMAPSSERRPR